MTIGTISTRRKGGAVQRCERISGTHCIGGDLGRTQRARLVFALFSLFISCLAVYT